VEKNETKINVADICESIPEKSVTENVVFTRTQFEELIFQFIQRIFVPIKEVLLEANMQKEEVDEIILVGGSTRVPLVRKLLGEFFDKEPNISVNPEQAVAIGAAVQAGIITDSWPVPIAAIEKPFVPKIKKHKVK